MIFQALDIKFNHIFHKNIMRTLLFLGFLMSITGVNFAQSRFSVQINADTVGLNNGAFQVYFTVENAQKVQHFQAPTFEGFAVQGPSQSNSTIISNTSYNLIH